MEMTVGPGPTTSYRPFDHIPNEILSLILEWTSFGLPDHTSKFSFPLKTSQVVCRRWREVTNTTPEVWTTLVIANANQSCDIDHYLSKSGALRLHGIILTTLGSDHASLIHAHKDRWDRIDLLKVNSHLDSEVILPPCTSLRHVTYFSPSSAVYMTLFQPCRSTLTILRILSSRFFLEPEKGVISFSCLTELVIDDINAYESVCVDTLLGGLRAAPQLRRLILSNLLLDLPEEFGAKTELKASRKAIMPCLQEMMLIEFLLVELFVLFWAIEAPELRLLGVGMVHESSQTIEHDELVGIKLDYPRLEELQILRVEVEGMRAIGFLFPPVSVLGICGSGYGGFAVTPDAGTPFSCISGLPKSFRSSVKVLKTRGLEMVEIPPMIQGCLDGLRMVRIFHDDVDSAEDLDTWKTNGMVQGVLIETWTDGRGEVWYPGPLEDREGWFHNCDF